MQPRCEYFEWFYEDVVDEKGKFIMSRLKKLAKEMDDAKMEFEKVRLTNEK